MASDGLFVDRVFVQALLDRNDQHHGWALRMLPMIQHAGNVVITEAILLEVASGLSSVNRVGASRFIRQCYKTSNITVVPTDHSLFTRGLTLSEDRPDKSWSLVDCISFVVMSDHGIGQAVTTVHHFEQAGFKNIE